MRVYHARNILKEERKKESGNPLLNNWLQKSFFKFLNLFYLFIFWIRGFFTTWMKIFKQKINEKECFNWENSSIGLGFQLFIGNKAARFLKTSRNSDPAGPTPETRWRNIITHVCPRILLQNNCVIKMLQEKIQGIRKHNKGLLHV